MRFRQCLASLSQERCLSEWNIIDRHCAVHPEMAFHGSMECDLAPIEPEYVVS